MALSQKHPDLMIVPWFNSKEWLYVKNCIWGEGAKQQEALDIIKLWKHRTPNLPIGVEGTLILLTALLEDSQIECNQQRFHCYGYALLRFVNISCSDSDKKSTLYHTAKKYNFPDWIVDIRHNLSHGQSLPGELEIHEALTTCLEWIKKEYWEKQKDTLQDYVKEKTDSTVSYIDLYCNVVVSQFLKREVTSFKELLKWDYCLEGKFSKFKELELEDDIEIGRSQILSHINGQFKDEWNVEDFCKVVVKYLNADVYDLSDAVNIPEDLLTAWKELLNHMYSVKLMLALISYLIKYCNSSDFYELSDSSVRTASLWLNCIFSELFPMKLQKGNGSQSDSGFYVHLNEILAELGSFEVDVITNCNKFTCLYLESLLQLAGNSEKYTESKLKQVEKTLINKINGAYTSETLPKEESNETDVSIKSPTFPTVKKRCKLVTDSKLFENCPLGMLPTQIQDYNPLIQFDFGI